MTSPFDFTDLDQRVAFQAADALVLQDRQQLEVTHPQFAARMYTNEYAIQGDITDYISCTATWKRNAVGTATIVLKGDDPLVDYAMACAQTVVPITITVNDLRWSGRIDTASDDLVDGVNTVTLQCVSDFNWFNHILCVAKGTLVLTTAGEVPIEQLVGAPCEVVVDGIPYRAPRGAWSNGVRPVYTLTTSGGKSITLTADHRILTPEGFVEARKVGVGGAIVTDYGGIETVVSFEPGGACEVFDIGVEETHRFVAAGIVVHNCWPSPLLPIEVQFPKEFILIGPACTVIETLITINAIRLQLGLWEIVNNILDPAAWFATMMTQEGLLTPIAVVPTPLLTDTSKWVAISARMDTVTTLCTQICKDNGLSLSADLWLPGEPQPTDAYTLTVPTIVVTVIDKSGVTGPTGTILDGLIEDVVDIVDGAFGEVVNPLIDSGYLPPGVTIAPALGINWSPPWPVYMVDNPRSGVKECHVAAHHALSHTVVGGGKSPSWVNKLIDLLLELLLSEILAAFGASGISSTLLDGIFDDVILAFQEFENAPRRLKLGTYAYPETFTSTGSTAWTLDEFFALEIAMWDTRGYYSAQLVTYDGIPYTFGRDFGIGDLVSWVRRNKMYTDYVSEATVVDDRSTRVQLIAKIGDGSAQESPWARIQRKMVAFESAVQIAMLSSN